MTQVDEKPLCESSVDHAFSLILLENSFGKTKEFLMAGNSGYVGYIIGLNTGSKSLDRFGWSCMLLFPGESEIFT